MHRHHRIQRSASIHLDRVGSSRGRAGRGFRRIATFRCRGNGGTSAQEDYSFTAPPLNFPVNVKPGLFQVLNSPTLQIGTPNVLNGVPKIEVEALSDIYGLNPGRVRRVVPRMINLIGHDDQSTSMAPQPFLSSIWPNSMACSLFSASKLMILTAVSGRIVSAQ
jgi:hypothetical protein